VKIFDVELLILPLTFVTLGQLLWQDNSALDFVNWGERQPSEEQLDYCVALSVFSSYWSILPCSSQKGFICKKQKSDFFNICS